MSILREMEELLKQLREAIDREDRRIVPASGHCECIGHIRSVLADDKIMREDTNLIEHNTHSS